MKDYVNYGIKKHGGSWKPDFCDLGLFENKIGFVAIFSDTVGYRHFAGKTKEEALRTLFKKIKDWKN